MFLEFVLEFLNWICFVRVDTLSFSSGFVFVVQLVSRCLFVSLTSRLVTLWTSPYVRVLGSVYYPDVSVLTSTYVCVLA